MMIDELIPETEGSVEIESEPLYCFCRLPWDKNKRRFMIQCDHCKEWFHGGCVGVIEQTSLAIEKYHCPKCEPSVGKSIYKAADHKPIQADTYGKSQDEKKFWTFTLLNDADEIIIRMRGQALTLPHLILKGFSRPIVVEEKDGLDLVVPADNFTVRDVEKYVGPDRMLDVIDVQKQCDIKMTMKEFSDYFTYPVRTQLYNLISLEFSKTELDKLVQAPEITRKLDWANSWPSGLDEEIAQRPQVSKYCLISTKDSYTDFHVDFGGTSVWYHILWGEKIFYLIEPTTTNLVLYQNWMSSTFQYETFFADTVDFCYRCVLKKGQTLFIPTGWIHAVLTPEDSLVFGGNFLHILNMETQLKIYEIEKKLNVPTKYLFPSFEATHWFAAEKVVNDIQSLNTAGVVPPHLYYGSVALLRALRTWSSDKEIGKNRKEFLPPNVNIYKLLGNLRREVRITDKRFHPNGIKTEKALKKPKENGEGPRKCQGVSPVPGSPTNSDKFAQKPPPVKLLISGLSSLSADGKTPSTSPSHGNAPIKLKLKKQSSQSGSRQSSPPYIATSGSMSDKEGNNASYQFSCGSFSPDGLKLRLSLYSPKNDSVDNDSNGGSDSLHIVDEDDGDRKVDVMDSAEVKNRRTKSHSKKKNKCKGHHRKREENLALDAELAGTFSGINELIKASNYTQRLAANESTSASMKEAVAEMLQSENLPLKRRCITKGKKRKREETGESVEEEYIEKVHQDNDYIYLPLTGGSDDDAGAEKGKNKKKKARHTEDEAWNPRVKVSSSSLGRRSHVPKRVDAKVEAVEKGLEQAAGMLSNLPEKTSNSKLVKLKSEKLSVKKIKHKKKHTNGLTSSASKSTFPLVVKAGHTMAGNVVGGQNVGIPKKLKKGMATPKQRLGRILKIHKLTKF